MSNKLDLLIRGGWVVRPEGMSRADLGVAEGRIVQIAREIVDPAAEVIEAEGLHLFPGIIDAHVHFNEPGRTDWEGLATGSAALAAGGGTLFFDMPLNSVPPVLDAESFGQKRVLAEQKSRLDFALWGGLVPGNLEKLGELRDAGAVGLKAFMCASGVDEFPAVTDAETLRKGMVRSAALGLLVAVHAEDNAAARRHTEAQRACDGRDARSWLATRPVEVELAAIRLALELAGETGCALHVVHVSSPEGVALIAEAKRRCVDVTAETCPHYLLLDENDVIRLGAIAKCAPPLRSALRRDELWRRVEDGEVDTIGSDHSPAPPELKAADDFFAIWGGISGCQHGFPLLLSEALARRSAVEALPRFAALLAGNVSKRFRLPTKGRLAEGFDADITFLDLRDHSILRNEDLLYRHRQGPYAGRPCNVRVVRNMLRGRTVFSDGCLVSGAPIGQFVSPKLL
jgi:allantoinase